MSESVATPETSQPGWVSVPAVAWVIDDAPVPADLAWTLLVIARRCDRDGKGSYQSIATIAEKAGKSEKQVRRDIQRLLREGLLREGDPARVAHLPAGRRPAVYDVPLDRRGPKPERKSRNEGGGKKNGTPPVHTTPPMEGTPPLDGSSRPPMDAPPTPPLEGSQRIILKNPSEEPSSSSGRSPTVAEVCRRAQVDEDEARLILEEIKTRHHPRSIGAYIRSMPNADLTEIRDELRAQRGKTKPPWCGTCDERSRLIHGETSSSHCPRCHPLAATATRALTPTEREAIANLAHRDRRRRMPGVGSAYVNNTDPDAYTELIPEDSPEEVARRSAMYTEDPWAAVTSTPLRRTGYKGPYLEDPNNPRDYSGPL